MLHYKFLPGLKLHHDILGQLDLKYKVSDTFQHPTTKRKTIISYLVYYHEKTEIYYFYRERVWLDNAKDLYTEEDIEELARKNYWDAPTLSDAKGAADAHLHQEIGSALHSFAGGSELITKLNATKLDTDEYQDFMDKISSAFIK